MSSQNRNDCPTFSGIGVQFKSESVSSLLRILHRRKGLYPEQIASWKNAFVRGATQAPSKAERELVQKQAKTIKQLEKELHRKEKALAETAALLVLRKKFQALWEEPEAERSASRSAKK